MYPRSLIFAGCTRVEAEKSLRRWLQAMAADAHRELETNLLCAHGDGEGFDPDAVDEALDEADAAWQRQIDAGVVLWLGVLEREGMIEH